jgi:hypothetical protein
MNTSSSSAAVDFSAPNLATIYGIKIKRLPSGAALGVNRAEWRRLNAEKKAALEHKAEERRGAPKVQRNPLRVEQTTRGWVVSLPDGSSIGPFPERDDAWTWVARHPSRR